MSRRPASCFPLLIVSILAGSSLTGCGGSERDIPAPPPIAASKPADAPTLAPSPSPETTMAAAPPEAAEAPVKAPESAPPAAAPAPAHTPGTSLPGAIPPAPAPDASTKPPEQPVDPLVWLRDSEARKADYQRRLEEANGNVINADAKVAEWEKNVLAFSNPFLARPKLSPEDASAISGMDGTQRVRWAQARLAEARTARDASQKALDDLKANPPLN